MKYRDQRAMRARNWKYLATEDGEYLFDLARDSRERANFAQREPDRLVAMRDAYARWEKTIPTLPEDAMFFIPFSRADLAHPSS